MGVVICYWHRPSLKDCFGRGKVVPGSYAAELVERVYEWYVDGALDLKAEYTKYYKPEYRSVEAFLYYRQGCTHGDLKAMKRDLSTDRRIGLVLGSM